MNCEHTNKEIILACLSCKQNVCLDCVKDHSNLRHGLVSKKLEPILKLEIALKSTQDRLESLKTEEILSLERQINYLKNELKVESKVFKTKQQVTTPDPKVHESLQNKALLDLHKTTKIVQQESLSPQLVQVSTQQPKLSLQEAQQLFLKQQQTIEKVPTHVQLLGQLSSQPEMPFLQNTPPPPQVDENKTKPRTRSSTGVSRTVKRVKVGIVGEQPTEIIN